MKLMDLMINKTYNDWTVLEARPSNRKGFVLAQCVCGKIKEVRGRSLKDNTSKNCGCKKGLKLRNRQRIPGTDSALRGVFSLYRSKAIRQEKKFELTVEEFKEITSKDCYFCSDKPNNISIKHKYIYKYNGIDRVDNDLGYIKSNIVPCCYMCNTKKGAITKDMVYKLYKFFEENK